MAETAFLKSRGGAYYNCLQKDYDETARVLGSALSRIEQGGEIVAYRRRVHCTPPFQVS
jgi:hypothetical protein